MSASAIFDSTARDEALLILAREGAPPLADPTLALDLTTLTAAFGNRATLTAIRDDSGRPHAIVQTPLERIAFGSSPTPSARAASPRELAAFDDIIPRIPLAMRAGDMGIDAMAANRIQHILSGEQRHTATPSAHLEMTTLARSPDYYVNRYINTAIAQSNDAHTAAVQTAISNARTQPGTLLRLNADDARLVPPTMRTIRMHNDDTVFAVDASTEASDLMQPSQSAIRYTDTRDAAAHTATLSTEQSAKLLTAIDPTHTVAEWNRTLTGEHTNDSQHRETERSTPTLER